MRAIDVRSKALREALASAGFQLGDLKAGSSIDIHHFERGADTPGARDVARRVIARHLADALLESSAVTFTETVEDGRLNTAAQVAVLLPGPR
ncbi:hypothetical protein [Methylobacterium sp. 17Sr1-1]|uniref:hypothetical protein n=1 Tax=Methylobacterium sp. 17Sr1-1 TaxID=2202826 RepID=UPI000D6EDC23|nr:hypothetical protein [Methylobacterium sp. 17Sr1-1]AWN51802.1 hypothetical protein DK412_08990 [Methylobacterium sp. 17Sr1-1]